MPSARPRILLVCRSFVKRRSDGKLLLIRRAGADRHLPGLWECPGGKLEEGQDLASVQEREVEEETGLLVKPILQLVYADSCVLTAGPYAKLPYVVIFGISEPVGGELALSHEHDAYQWVTYTNLCAETCTLEVLKAAVVLEKHLK